MIRLPKRRSRANGPTLVLTVLGAVQVAIWIAVAVLAQQFSPGREDAQRPLVTVVGLMGVAFVIYLASLALVWESSDRRSTIRTQVWVVLLFALFMRLPLWWSQPIQEIDLYRYLWDGRALQAGVSPYAYSPAQVDESLRDDVATPELERLTAVLRRSPEVAEAFSVIHHREVSTIYPPVESGRLCSRCDGDAGTCTRYDAGSRDEGYSALV